MSRQYEKDIKTTPETGNLDTLIKLYKRNAIELCVLAQEMPGESNISEDIIKKEDGLMSAQTAILETASRQDLKTSADINSTLELWYQSTVKEMCEQDLSPSDRLILSLYKNRHILA